MIKRLILACLALGACGDDVSGYGLEGTWGMRVDDKCSLTFSVEAGRYSVTSLCAESDIAVNVEIQSGSIIVAGSDMTTFPDASSCSPGAVNPDKVAFEVRGNALEIESPEGVIVLKRDAHAEVDASTVRYGCFINGDFRPGQLRAFGPLTSDEAQYPLKGPLAPQL